MEFPRGKGPDIVLGLWLAAGTFFFLRQFWPTMSAALSRIFGRA